MNSRLIQKIPVLTQQLRHIRLEIYSQPFSQNPWFERPSSSCLAKLAPCGDAAEPRTKTKQQSRGLGTSSRGKRRVGYLSKYFAGGGNRVEPVKSLTYAKKPGFFPQVEGEASQKRGSLRSPNTSRPRDISRDLCGLLKVNAVTRPKRLWSERRGFAQRNKAPCDPKTVCIPPPEAARNSGSPLLHEMTKDLTCNMQNCRCRGVPLMEEMRKDLYDCKTKVNEIRDLVQTVEVTKPKPSFGVEAPCAARASVVPQTPPKVEEQRSVLTRPHSQERSEEEKILRELIRIGFVRKRPDDKKEEEKEAPPKVVPKKTTSRSEEERILKELIRIGLVRKPGDDTKQEKTEEKLKRKKEVCANLLEKASCCEAEKPECPPPCPIPPPQDPNHMKVDPKRDAERAGRCQPSCSNRPKPCPGAKPDPCKPPDPCGPKEDPCNNPCAKFKPGGQSGNPMEGPNVMKVDPKGDGKSPAKCPVDDPMETPNCMKVEPNRKECPKKEEAKCQFSAKSGCDKDEPPGCCTKRQKWGEEEALIETAKCPKEDPCKPKCPKPCPPEPPCCPPPCKPPPCPKPCPPEPCPKPCDPCKPPCPKPDPCKTCSPGRSEELANEFDANLAIKRAFLRMIDLEGATASISFEHNRATIQVCTSDATLPNRDRRKDQSPLLSEMRKDMFPRASLPNLMHPPIQFGLSPDTNLNVNLLTRKTGQLALKQQAQCYHSFSGKPPEIASIKDSTPLLTEMRKTRSLLRKINDPERLEVDAQHLEMNVRSWLDKFTRKKTALPTIKAKNLIANENHQLEVLGPSLVAKPVCYSTTPTWPPPDSYPDVKVEIPSPSKPLPKSPASFCKEPPPHNEDKACKAQPPCKKNPPIKIDPCCPIHGKEAMNKSKPTCPEECPKKDVCAKKEECPKKDVCAKKEECPKKDVCPKKEECPKKDVCAKKEECPEKDVCPKKEECPKKDVCAKKEECPKKDVCPKKGPVKVCKVPAPPCGPAKKECPKSCDSKPPCPPPCPKPPAKSCEPPCPKPSCEPPCPKSSCDPMEGPNVMKVDPEKEGGGSGKCDVKKEPEKVCGASKTEDKKQGDSKPAAVAKSKDPGVGRVKEGKPAPSEDKGSGDSSLKLGSPGLCKVPEWYKKLPCEGSGKVVERSKRALQTGEAKGEVKEPASGESQKPTTCGALSPAPCPMPEYKLEEGYKEPCVPSAKPSDKSCKPACPKPCPEPPVCPKSCEPPKPPCEPPCPKPSCEPPCPKPSCEPPCPKPCDPMAGPNTMKVEPPPPKPSCEPPKSCNPLEGPNVAKVDPKKEGSSSCAIADSNSKESAKSPSVAKDLPSDKVGKDTVGERPVEGSKPQKPNLGCSEPGFTKNLPCMSPEKKVDMKQLLGVKTDVKEAGEEVRSPPKPMADAIEAPPKVGRAEKEAGPKKESPAKSCKPPSPKPSEPACPKPPAKSCEPPCPKPSCEPPCPKPPVKSCGPPCPKPSCKPTCPKPPAKSCEPPCPKPSCEPPCPKSSCDPMEGRNVMKVDPKTGGGDSCTKAGAKESAKSPIQESGEKKAETSSLRDSVVKSTIAERPSVEDRPVEGAKPQKRNLYCTEPEFARKLPCMPAEKKVDMKQLLGVKADVKEAGKDPEEALSLSKPKAEANEPRPKRDVRAEEDASPKKESCNSCVQDLQRVMNSVCEKSPCPETVCEPPCPKPCPKPCDQKKDVCAKPAKAECPKVDVCPKPDPCEQKKDVCAKAECPKVDVCPPKPCPKPDPCAQKEDVCPKPAKAECPKVEVCAPKPCPKPDPCAQKKDVCPKPAKAECPKVDVCAPKPKDACPPKPIKVCPEGFKYCDPCAKFETCPKEDVCESKPAKVECPKKDVCPKPVKACPEECPKKDVCAKKGPEKVCKVPAPPCAQLKDDSKCEEKCPEREEDQCTTPKPEDTCAGGSAKSSYPDIPDEDENIPFDHATYKYLCDQCETKEADPCESKAEDKCASNNEDICDFNPCGSKAEDKCAAKKEDKCAPIKEDKCAPKKEDKCAAKKEDKCASKKEDKCAPKKEDSCAPKKEDSCGPKKEDKCASKKEDKCASKKEDKCASKKEDSCGPKKEDKCASKKEDSCGPKKEDKSVSKEGDQCETKKLDQSESNVLKAAPVESLFGDTQLVAETQGKEGGSKRPQNFEEYTKVLKNPRSYVSILVDRMNHTCRCKLDKTKDPPKPGGPLGEPRVDPRPLNVKLKDSYRTKDSGGKRPPRPPGDSGMEDPNPFAPKVDPRPADVAFKDPSGNVEVKKDPATKYAKVEDPTKVDSYIVSERTRRRRYEFLEYENNKKKRDKECPPNCDPKDKESAFGKEAAEEIYEGILVDHQYEIPVAKPKPITCNQLTCNEVPKPRPLPEPNVCRKKAPCLPEPYRCIKPEGLSCPEPSPRSPEALSCPKPSPPSSQALSYTEPSPPELKPCSPAVVSSTKLPAVIKPCRSGANMEHHDWVPVKIKCTESVQGCRVRQDRTVSEAERGEGFLRAANNLTAPQRTYASPRLDRPLPQAAGGRSFLQGAKGLCRSFMEVFVPGWKPSGGKKLLGVVSEMSVPGRAFQTPETVGAARRRSGDEWHYAYGRGQQNEARETLN